MELDVLGIDDPRPGPGGHRQTIAARPRRVGRVAVNPPQAAGGQDGFGRQGAVNSLALMIEDIRAITGDRLVGIERVARMMGIGDQINGGGIRQQFDIRLAADSAHQALDNGVAGAVANMQNPADGMRRLLPEIQATLGVQVEPDPGFR